MKKLLAIVVLGLMLTSCIARNQFPEDSYGKQGTYSSWAPGIKVVDRLPQNATIISTVKKIRCNRNFSSDAPDGGATVEMVEIDLTHKAAKLGADGIADMKVSKKIGAGSGAMYVFKNCISIIDGSATAFKYTSRKKIETKTPNKNNMIEDLERLNKLYKEGILTKQEFEKAKKRILEN